MNRKLGLYRFDMPGLGEAARTHALAGDASPYLDREMYEALSFQPPFDSLPTRSEYFAMKRSDRLPVRTCDLIWEAEPARRPIESKRFRI